VKRCFSPEKPMNLKGVFCEPGRKTTSREEEKKNPTGRFPDDEIVTSFSEAAMAAARSASFSSEVARG